MTETELKVKLDTYHECIAICLDVEGSTGNLTAAGANMVRSQIQDSIEDAELRLAHVQAVAAM